MLLLFETAAGFALFKVLQENKIQETEVSRSYWQGRPPALLALWVFCDKLFCYSGPLERL